MSEVFDDMNGEFSARLRAHRVTTRTSRTQEAEVTLTSQIAVVEARFSLNVLDKLHEPSFIGLRRPTSKGETFIIYEVIGVRPMHFQMLGMDVAVPKVIRKEFLETIDRSWMASEETWIDVIAVPTEYRMDLNENSPVFGRSNIRPLVGSEAHVLSRETVKNFLCVEGGVQAGTLIGFNLPLTVNMMDMVRYHTGFFGFTGCGKSNLSSYLLRKSIEKMSDMSIVVFDVAGEYLIHLLDLAPRIFSTEDFRDDVQRIMDSQAIPETLEQKLGGDSILGRVRELVNMGKVERLSMTYPLESIPLNMGSILHMLGDIARKREKESIQATIAVNALNRFALEKGYDDTTPLEEIAQDSDARLQLEEILQEFVSSVHSMSGTAKDIQRILSLLSESSIETKKAGERKESMVKNAEWLAGKVAIGDYTGLNIVYAPDPIFARQVVSRFIDRLLWLKKTKGVGRTVLTVLDEAQEFIPDQPRRKDDFTEQSNRAVEALLRQGRKYRANCWICSQRVAHLNVNALQQLHSYFVSTLPRFYDRMVIADAFSLSYDILDRTTDLETGEWLFVSYKATKQKNVPVFVRTPNNEEILAANLTKTNNTR